MAVPYTFATATSSIPLSQLDSNFSTPITLGNTSIQLGNTVTTLNNMTLANVTVSSVASTFPNNYLANSTATLGNATITLGGTTTTVGNLTLTNATISSGTYSVTNATVSGDLTLSGGTANGVAYLNGSKVLTTGSALTFDGNVLTNTSGAIRASGSVVPSAGAGIELLYGASGTGISTILSYDRGAGAYKPLWVDGSYQAYFVSGSEQMRLTSTGLGIGTSSPATKLHLYTGAAATTLTIDSGTSGTAISYNLAGVSKYTAEYVSASDFYSIGRSGVAYDLILKSGNLGLGVTPSAFSGLLAKTLQVGNSYIATNSATASAGYFGVNNYYDGSNFRYINSTQAELYAMEQGTHKWFTAASGTAGDTITFTQAMTLDASGNLGVGTTSPGTRLQLTTSASDADVLRITGGSSQQLDIGVNNSNGGPYLFSSGSFALRFGTNGSERARIDSSGNFLIGTAAIATNATDGFLYIPTCAGTPTGTPTAKTGLAPMVIDSTNNKMYIYSGGAWNALN